MGKRRCHHGRLTDSCQLLSNLYSKTLGKKQLGYYKSEMATHQLEPRSRKIHLMRNLLTNTDLHKCVGSFDSIELSHLNCVLDRVITSLGDDCHSARPQRRQHGHVLRHLRDKRNKKIVGGTWAIFVNQNYSSDF